MKSRSRYRVAIARRMQSVALTACFVWTSMLAPALALSEDELPAAPSPQMQFQGASAIAANSPESPVKAAQSLTSTAPIAPTLKIVILEGEDVSNNIKQRTAREPIVQVEDENHKPVAGAAVLFSIDSQGGQAGASFLNGASTFSGYTDANGQIHAQGFHPNSHVGQFHINVTASKGPLSTRAQISQTNVAAAATAAGITGFVASHILLVSIGAAAIVATGVSVGLVETQGNGTTITTGTGTVGAPQVAGGLRRGIHR